MAEGIPALKIWRQKSVQEIEHSDIIRKLREGHSVRNTAKITGKGGSTMQRVKAALLETV